MILKTMCDVLPARALIEKDLDEVTQLPATTISIEKVRVTIIRDLAPYKKNGDLLPARIYIIRENGGRSATKTTIVLEEDVLFYTKQTKFSGLEENPYTLHEVITTLGTVVTFSKMKKCSCGSRLRSWSPHLTYRASRSPNS